MCKKRIETQVNPYDEKMHTLRNELAEIGWNMGKKVKKAYLTSQAIVLYQENTPNWAQACEDRAEAQKSLFCSIREYEAKRTEILAYSHNYGDKFEQSWSDTITSHEWIERELEFLLLKK